jgi:hypothetical protein
MRLSGHFLFTLTRFLRRNSHTISRRALRRNIEWIRRREELVTVA